MSWLRALIRIVSGLLTVVARYVYQVLRRLRDPLAARSGRRRIGLAHRGRASICIWRPAIVASSVLLLVLLDSVGVRSASSFAIFIAGMFGPVAVPPLVLFGLQGLWLHRELLKLVTGGERPLSFQYCLLACSSSVRTGECEPGLAPGAEASAPPAY